MNDDILAVYARFVGRMTLTDYKGDVVQETSTTFNSLRLMDRAKSGMCNELGEISEHIHNAIYRGHDLDNRKLMIETGDMAFYLQMLCNAMCVTLDEVIRANMVKLDRRYPDGVGQGDIRAD